MVEYQGRHYTRWHCAGGWGYRFDIEGVVLYQGLVHQVVVLYQVVLYQGYYYRPDIERVVLYQGWCHTRWYYTR